MFPLCLESPWTPLKSRWSSHDNYASPLTIKLIHMNLFDKIHQKHLSSHVVTQQCFSCFASEP